MVKHHLISNRAVRTYMASIAILLLSSLAHGGGLLFVDDDAPPGGDGKSWETAYRFLADALVAAGKGQVGEIRVAQGVYKPDRDEANPDGTGDREATFQLINGLALLGGYAGIGAKDPDARDIELYETILSGDLLGDDEPDFVNNDENSYHVVRGNAIDETAVLDGVTITAGNADGSGDQGQGGGMYNSGGASPTVTSCTFVANSANFGGGGMYNRDHSSPLVTGCAFIENMTDLIGGAGMYNSNHSSPTVIDSTFNANGGLGPNRSTLGNATNPSGGGMRNHGDSSPTVIGCTFVANVGAYGGGMYNTFNSNPAVTNCIFSGNSANASGGGMSNLLNSNPTVTNCTFSENSADNGGGMANTLSSPTVANCTFSGNSAENGGGMSNSDSSPAVTDCTFSGNSAGDGGGGMGNIGGSSPAVINCTFVANSANLGGGGMYNRDHSNPLVTGCAFIENTTLLIGGAGMYNSEDSSPTVIDCTFNGNLPGGLGPNGAPLENATTPIGGGMFNYFNSNPTVTNCTFVANVAALGGGMFNFSNSNPAVTNCTFSENSASLGGGMFNNSNSNPTVTNCTFSDNSASGILTFDDSETTVANCIVWGNANGQIVGVAITVSYSCVEGGFQGAGNIDGDPMFVAPGSGDYRLSAGSPCIDAGHNWGVPVDVNDYDEDGITNELFPVDLDGNPRFNADEADFDPGCGVPVVVDMGAYEYQFDPVEDVIFADLNGDGSVGVADLLGLLGDWGPCAKGCCMADLDLDGAVGVADFLILLANWG